MKFEITTKPSNNEIDYLSDQINKDASEYRPIYSFSILVRNKSGTITAGANGSIIFGSIYTDQLWVDSSIRKKGIGRQLMEEVHQLGKQCGCTLATLTTMSFQAPDFYEKLGYKIDFIKEGYEKNSSRIFMSKSLT